MRHAKNTHLFKKPDGCGNPEIVGCVHDLVKLRDEAEFNKKHGGPEKYLSVNWLEFFEGKEEERLHQFAEDFGSARKIKKSDTFVKLNVGTFKAICQMRSAKVRIIHDPGGSTIKSHGSIRQLPQDDDLLFDDLCELAFTGLLSASSFII
ncbi:MAG: hypothetical protein EXR08_10985 [Alphaproteobacteria bacterium]|nr:hypothetical protein [Alphaproteobacteria bacterium]